MTEIIDLRSDTVTRPTPAMREAIAHAEVGDDIFGDDPTVNRLQERFAALAGKDAALFTPSGTQANQIAIMVHTRPGDEVICDANSHIVHYETGAPAVLSGVSIRPVEGDRGVFTAGMLEAAIRPDNIHNPASALVVIENTHNRGGGSVWPLETLRAVTAAAHARGLRAHLDGARIFNAAAATGVPLRDWAAHFDSISVCFSKGLGAPAGSMLAGSREFIARARRMRKMLGGAMRQAGILAAAAEHALDHHVERLAEDHAKARELGDAIAACAAFEPEPVPTNMVFWRLRATPAEAQEFHARCRARGVWFNLVGGTRFRAVTHLDVSPEQVDRAAEIICAEARV
jgi:threonine aldolase